MNRRPDDEEEILRRFVHRMRIELDANRYKGPWKEIDKVNAAKEVAYHTEKLVKSLSTGTFEDVLEHSADVAVCSMFAAFASGCLNEQCDDPGNQGKVFTDPDRSRWRSPPPDFDLYEDTR
jgi:hypothetical protein